MKIISESILGLSIGLPLFAKTLALDDLVIIIIAYFDAIVVNAIFVLYRSSIGLYLGTNWYQGKVLNKNIL